MHGVHMQLYKYPVSPSSTILTRCESDSPLNAAPSSEIGVGGLSRNNDLSSLLKRRMTSKPTKPSPCLWLKMGIVFVKELNFEQTCFREHQWCRLENKRTTEEQPCIVQRN